MKSWISHRGGAESAERKRLIEKLSELRELCVSVVRRIRKSHRGGAEDAEESVLDQEMFRTLRTPRLCGKP